MSQADVLTAGGRTAVLHQLDDATDRLLRTVGSLGELDIRAPSSLPGWTRAHVLAHLARNAEALANLLRGVRTGTPAAAYASHEARATPPRPAAAPAPRGARPRRGGRGAPPPRARRSPPRADRLRRTLPAGGV